MRGEGKAMTRLMVTIGLMLAPAGLQAQGLPVDFDADFFENQAPRQEVEPAAIPAHAETAPPRDAVRYGERQVMIERATAREPRIAKTSSGS
jgi:hypothetical protein